MRGAVRDDSGAGECIAGLLIRTESEEIKRKLPKIMCVILRDKLDERTERQGALKAVRCVGRSVETQSLLTWRRRVRARSAFPTRNRSTLTTRRRAIWRLTTKRTTTARRRPRRRRAARARRRRQRRASKSATGRWSKSATGCSRSATRCACLRRRRRVLSIISLAQIENVDELVRRFKGDDIDGSALTMLDKADLVRLGVVKVGHQKKFLKALSDAQIAH